MCISPRMETHNAAYGNAYSRRRYASRCTRKCISPHAETHSRTGRAEPRQQGLRRAHRVLVPRARAPRAPQHCLGVALAPREQQRLHEPLRTHEAPRGHVHPVPRHTHHAPCSHDQRPPPNTHGTPCTMQPLRTHVQYPSVNPRGVSTPCRYAASSSVAAPTRAAPLCRVATCARIGMRVRRMAARTEKPYAYGLGHVTNPGAHMSNAGPGGAHRETHIASSTRVRTSLSRRRPRCGERPRSAPPPRTHTRTHTRGVAAHPRPAETRPPRPRRARGAARRRSCCPPRACARGRWPPPRARRPSLSPRASARRTAPRRA